MHKSYQWADSRALPIYSGSAGLELRSGWGALHFTGDSFSLL
jgi:hypothetical protein